MAQVQEQMGNDFVQRVNRGEVEPRELPFWLRWLVDWFKDLFDGPDEELPPPQVTTEQQVQEQPLPSPTPTVDEAPPVSAEPTAAPVFDQSVNNMAWLRTGPDHTAAQLELLQPGVKLAVLGQVQGSVPQGFSTAQWSRVLLEDGREGYIFSELVGAAAVAPTQGPTDSQVGSGGGNLTFDQVKQLVSSADESYFGSKSPFVPTYGGLDYHGEGQFGGQCTWFVWGIRKGAGAGLGNAKTWVDWDDQGFRTPSIGSIAVFGNGEAGHVAYVLGYSEGADGEVTLDLLESNANWDERVRRRSGVKAGGDTGLPVRFIN